VRSPLTANSKAGRRVASDPRLCLSTVEPRFPQPLGGPVTHWATYYAHHAPNGLPRRCFRGIIENGSHYNFYPSAAGPTWRKDGEFAGGRAMAFRVWPAQNPVGCFGTLPPRTTLYSTPSVRRGNCRAKTVHSGTFLDGKPGETPSGQMRGVSPGFLFTS
jgi:hypothetical protein